MPGLTGHLLPPPAAGPSFWAIFVGSTVTVCSQAVILGRFRRLNCHRLQPGRHFGQFSSAQLSPSAAGPSFWAVFDGRGAGRCSSAQRTETGPARSLDVSTPPHTVPAFGQARNVVEQVPSCRLRRHRSLHGPTHIPVSAHSLRNQRPGPGASCRPAAALQPGRHFRPFLSA